MMGKGYNNIGKTWHRILGIEQRCDQQSQIWGEDPQGFGLMVVEARTKVVIRDEKSGGEGIRSRVWDLPRSGGGGYVQWKWRGGFPDRRLAIEIVLTL